MQYSSELDEIAKMTLKYAKTYEPTIEPKEENKKRGIAAVIDINDIDDSLITKYSMILKGVKLKKTQAAILEYSRKDTHNKLIVTLDTGLGKTYLAIAKAMLDIALFDKGKYIFVVQNTTLEKWKKDIREVSGFDFMAISGEASEVKKLKSFRAEHKLVIMTYSALYNIDTIHWILENYKDFEGIVFDESKELANFNSAIHKIARELSNYFNTVWELNAAPAEIHPDQLIAQLSVLEGNRNLYKYKGVFIDKDGNLKNLNALTNLCRDKVIGWSRPELGLIEGYETAKFVCPTVKDKLKVIENILSIKGKNKILIYANRDENKDLLYNKFQIPYLDGRNSNIRTNIERWFNETDDSILTSNITEGLNLECDTFVFFELTTSWRQFIGRGRRGYDSNKKKNVVWLPTSLEEMQTKIYSKSEIQCLLNMVNLEPIN